MAEMVDVIAQKLNKLAHELKLNEQELKRCIQQAKQLSPHIQQQYLNLLDNIQAQLKLVNVGQLQKVKSVLGNQKHSGPALLSHIETCLTQNQLVTNSISQTKALIEQAFHQSLNDPGKRSRVQQANTTRDMEEQEQDAQNNPNTNQAQPSAPRPGGPQPGSQRARPNTRETMSAGVGNTLRNPTATPSVPHNTPLRSNTAILRPEMVALARTFRQKDVYTKQQNIRQELRRDAYVDEQILDLDASVDREILKKERETNKALSYDLRETRQLEQEEDRYIKREILASSRELKDDFIERQKSIKKELAELIAAARTATSESTAEDTIRPQFK